MPKAAVDFFRRPWVAVIAGWLVALGTMGLTSETTWGDLARPSNVFAALALLGAQALALYADRPGSGGRP